MQTEFQIKQQEMQYQHEFDMELKEIEIQAMQEKETRIEDRKDKRTKMEGTQQSKMIEQRNTSGLPTDFEKETPEHTEGYEGFYHLHHIEGKVEKTVLKYIIRDHDFDLFEARKTTMKQLVEALNRKYNNVTFDAEIKDQYFNMKEKVIPVMHCVDIAEEAMKSLAIVPLIKPIRGGTDGSQLSYMGLPCPNIFAGGHNFHGR